MKRVVLPLFVALLLLTGVFVSRRFGSREQQTKTHAPAERSQVEFNLMLLSPPENIQSGKDYQLVYTIMRGDGKTVLEFDTVHTKIMHLIIVRDDLKHFQHLHPSLDDKTGNFALTVMFSANGRYRLFADFTPSKDNPQHLAVVASKELSVGDSSTYVPEPIITDVERTDISDGYTITYIIPQNPKATQTFTFGLHITKDGQEVTDLEPYLGALGHSVLIRADTFDYIHTHPTTEHATMEDHQAKKSEATIEFSTSVPQPGTYKIFTQFQHQGKVVTTDYTMELK